MGVLNITVFLSLCRIGKILLPLSIILIGNLLFAQHTREEKPPGNYEVEFDGSNLSSGVYFYRLSAGQYTEAKKLILLK